MRIHYSLEALKLKNLANQAEQAPLLKNVSFAHASSNLPGLNLIPAVGANVYDILKHDTLVLTRSAVEKLEARFNG